ncbi:MAG: tRNA pseudouridine(38-40) synthase TruA [Oligoflexia bacterium]|nr:tRNA pseudouridine(38-40) synthase TruA [Oligoflexia bacterium]
MTTYDCMSNSNLNSKFNYKFIVQYKGTNYSGWQIQTKGGLEHFKSVQGEIEFSLRKMCNDNNNNNVKIVGASRTDAKVHALGQVFKATIPIEIPLKGLHLGLNSLLPPDIRIVEVTTCDEKFHPRKDAKWKEYLYIFKHRPQTNQANHYDIFYQDLIANYPYQYKNFDLPKMIEACKYFEGKHSFKNFYCKGSDVKTFEREIYKCELFQFEFKDMFTSTTPPTPLTDTKDTINLNLNLNPTFYQLRIIGNGFLKQMVRLIVGTLWNIGNGKVEFSELQSALRGELDETKHLGCVAAAEGLYLNKISYGEFQ